MTDEQLRDALIEAQDYMLSQFSTKEWHYDFSPKFHKKMKELIELDEHPVWFYVRRTAVIMFAVLGISGVLLFGFSEKVRAEVIRWFTERFAENEYRYRRESDTEVDISRYTLEGKVPEGYQLIKRKEDADQVSEIYEDSDGNRMIFTAMSSTQNKEFWLMFDKNTESEVVYVNGTNADIYLPENREDNTVIAWQGKDGVLFSIIGYAGKEELIEMAESIEWQK